jgi:hypothetical protein
MEQNKIQFVGYWNKDFENPRFEFSIPTNVDNYELVVITLDPIKPVLKENMPSRELRDIKKLNRGLKKIAESMRKVNNVK